MYLTKTLKARKTVSIAYTAQDYKELLKTSNLKTQCLVTSSHFQLAKIALNLLFILFPEITTECSNFYFSSDTIFL